MHLISRFKNIRFFQKRFFRSSRFGLRLILALGILLFVLVSRASAAETVLLQNFDARLSIPISELQEFAKTGTLSAPLQIFLTEADQDPAVLREVLNSPIRLGQTPLLPREFALIQINRAIGDPLGREDQLKILSQALQKSARSDQKITLLELVENYPNRSVRISLDQVIPIYKDVSQLLDRFVPILSVVEQLLPEMVCDAQGKPIFTAASRTAARKPDLRPSEASTPTKLLTLTAASTPTPLPNRTLVFALGPFQPSITLQELTTFVETGVLPRGWQFYLNVAGVDAENLRAVLNQPVKADAQVLDKLLNNIFGEYLLYQVGQVLHTPSHLSDIQALRSAIILSAIDNGTVTFLELLQNYPLPRLMVDVGQLIKFGNQVQQFTGGSGLEGAVATIDDFLINWQVPIAQEKCLGQPLPTADRPRVTPLQISPARRAQYLPSNWQPVPSHKEKVGKINVVWLTGTPYEMGLQQGQLLKNEIATLGEPVLTVLDLFGRGLGLARLAEKRSFPYAIEECRGMAEGAKDVGFTYDACMVLAFGDVYQYAFGNALPQELLWEGCSQFVATGPATLNGELYHGSTVDSPTPMYYLINNPVVMVRQPNDGLPHIFVTYPGVVWPNSGMNVASITLGLDTAVTDATGLSFYGGSNVQFMAEILQGATRFDEAVNFLENQPRVRPNIIMGADGKSQQAGVFEFSGTAFEVRRMGPEDVIYTTNHFTSEKMYDQQVQPEQSSLLRYQRYQQLLDPSGRDSVYGEIDASVMAKILRDRINPETLQPSPLTVFDDNASPGGNGAQRQAVFESKPMLFWIAAGQPPVPENAFQCFSLGKLLGFPNAATCPAPVID